MEKGSIAVIILVFNEEKHIERSITNAKQFASEIFVVDSFSTDKTREIAQSLGAAVYTHKWENYARQFSWSLKNLPIKSQWIWRMDADEYLSSELITEVTSKVNHASDTVNGFTAPCLRIFLGKYIKHGILPLILLRLFRKGSGYIEDKQMDEHIVLTSGEVHALKHPFYDDNLNGITWWTNKHNGYATREAIDLLMTEYGLLDNTSIQSGGTHSASIRRKKLKYIRLPLFWRAFFFFILRYIFRLGFLDGKEGFLWHFLQGFWYRALADAKVFEIKKQFRFDDVAIKQYLIDNYVHTDTNE